MFFWRIFFLLCFDLERMRVCLFGSGIDFLMCLIVLVMIFFLLVFVVCRIVLFLCMSWCGLCFLFCCWRLI